MVAILNLQAQDGVGHNRKVFLSNRAWSKTLKSPLKSGHYLVWLLCYRYLIPVSWLPYWILCLDFWVSGGHFDFKQTKLTSYMNYK